MALEAHFSCFIPVDFTEAYGDATLDNSKRYCHWFHSKLVFTELSCSSHVQMTAYLFSLTSPRMQSRYPTWHCLESVIKWEPYIQCNLTVLWSFWHKYSCERCEHFFLSSSCRFITRLKGLFSDRSRRMRAKMGVRVVIYMMYRSVKGVAEAAKILVLILSECRGDRFGGL